MVCKNCEAAPRRRKSWRTQHLLRCCKVRRALLESRDVVAAEAERWSVHGGRQMQRGGPPMDLSKDVERATFLKLLNGLLDIVYRSAETGFAIVCFED